MPLEEILGKCKEYAKTSKKNESIDMIIRLGIDTNVSSQQVRGTVVMPGGTSKEETICVLTSPDYEGIATEAGADMLVTEELLNQIQETGEVGFSKLIATRESVKDLKPFARVLGPLGLFPNAKSGTLVGTNDLEETIKTFKAGKIELRSDIGGQIKACLGKATFDNEKLISNFDAVIDFLKRAKPEEFKGLYMKKATVSSSTGRGLKLDIAQYA